MFSAGLGAVVATLMSWISVVIVGGARPAWAAALQTFGLEIALAFLPAAVAAPMIMPRAADLSRPIRPDESASTAPGLLLLLGALALLAFLQAPSVAAWWAEDRALLRQALGSSPDPMGFNLIPQVMLLSLPTLAGAAVTGFVLTSILGMLVRVEFAFSSLAACAVLQAGLVIGLQLIVHAVRALGGTIQGLFTTAPDAIAAAQAAEWFARHDAAGTDVSWRLVWILGGYVVAVVATEFISPRRTRLAGKSALAPTEPLPVAALPSSTAPRSSPASSVAAAFDYTSYSVRPRHTLLGMALRQFSEYDIQSIPPMSRARFSFSWRTERLRREPNGPELLALRTAERHGVLRARSFLVIDVAADTPIGTLRPNGPDWEILDRSGALAARVGDEKTGIGFTCYVARVGDQVACRFTWSLQGLSVASAGLDVEFLPGSDARLDRALAIALAPILEHKARTAAGHG
jgi:hypothetical protein